MYKFIIYKTNSIVSPVSKQPQGLVPWLSGTDDLWKKKEVQLQITSFMGYIDYIGNN